MPNEIRLLEAAYLNTIDPIDAEPEDMPFGFERFARIVKRIPLLNAEEERQCARAIQRVRRATPDNLPSETETAEAERAIWTLFHHSMRLVFSIAHQFYGPPFEDRVAEGFFGLRRACEDYDGRGRFSTYATSWIWHAINRGIADTANIIRLPAHSFDTYNRIRRAYAKFITEQGGEPTITQIAVRAKTTPAQVRRLVQIMHNHASLDRPLSFYSDDENDETLANRIPDPSIPDPDAAILQIERRALLVDALTRLADVKGRRYAQVLILRYRLDEGMDALVGKRELRTYEELAARFKVKRQRIQQYENKARGWLLEHCHEFVAYMTTV